MIRPKNSGGIKLPAGRYVATITDVTDLGREETPYGEKERLLIVNGRLASTARPPKSNSG